METDPRNLNLQEILTFFDERPADSRGHASAIIGLIGEELGCGLLCRFLQERRGCTANPDAPTLFP